MKIGTPVESLAASVYAAINDKNILPDIKNEWGGKESIDRPTLNDFKIIHFPQTWGSTSLGFGGIGGAAMSTAYTTVILCRENAAVFFAGRHCYSIDNYCDKFKEDLAKMAMPSLSEASKRYK